MLAPGQLEQIRQFAEDVASREGCLLYDLEYRDGPGRTLRVFIDKQPGGVSIDDCANVSRGLNLRLDIEDVIPGGAYELEVSSPGLDRKLTQAWHYGAAIGKIIKLVYTPESGANGQSYDGLLTAVEGQTLSLENGKGPFSLNIGQIQKARIVPGDVLKKKPAPGNKKKR